MLIINDQPTVIRRWFFNCLRQFPSLIIIFWLLCGP